MRTLLPVMMMLPILLFQGVNAEEWEIDSLQQGEAEQNIPTGTLSGMVLDAICGHPVQYMNVCILGMYKGAMSDEGGKYIIQEIPCGYHSVVAFNEFYKRIVIDSVLIRSDEISSLNIRMHRTQFIEEGEGTCYQVTFKEPAVARYSDKRAVFQVQLSLGASWIWKKRLICIVTIENITSQPLDFPVPTIMPLGGNTNKNNIRIYRSSGSELDIVGAHYEYFNHGPMVTIEGGTFRSWAFHLDSHFKDFYQPGGYEIEFWYFFEEELPNTWQGRVVMPPIPYSVERYNE